MVHLHGNNGKRRNSGGSCHTGYTLGFCCSCCSLCASELCCCYFSMKLSLGFSSSSRCNATPIQAIHMMLVEQQVHVRAAAIGTASAVFIYDGISLAFRPWHVHKRCPRVQLVAGWSSSTFAVLEINKCFRKHAVE